MAKSLGSSADVAVDSTTAMSSATDIAEVMSAELPQSVNAVDCTTNDDAGNKTYLAGDYDSTFTIEFAYSPDDAGQIEFLNAFDAKTTLAFRFRPTVGTGENQWIFYGIITDCPVSASHEEFITVSATVQVTDGITRSAQA